MGSSPGFVSTNCYSRPLQTRFPFGSGCPCLNLATIRNSLAHSPKGTPSLLPPLWHSLRLLVDARFQVLFHSPHRGPFHLSLTVLLLYRSSRVFSLGQWPALLPTGLACPVVLWILCASSPLSPTGLSPPPVGLPSAIRLGSSPRCCLAVQPYSSSTPMQQRPHASSLHRFGLLPFRSPLLRESSLFLWVLRCFSSPRSPPTPTSFNVGCLAFC